VSSGGVARYRIRVHSLGGVAFSGQAASPESRDC
jgi:hypothetical protein